MDNNNFQPINNTPPINIPLAPLPDNITPPKKSSAKLFACLFAGLFLVACGVIVWLAMAKPTETAGGETKPASNGDAEKVAKEEFANINTKHAYERFLKPYHVWNGAESEKKSINGKRTYDFPGYLYEHDFLTVDNLSNEYKMAVVATLISSNHIDEMQNDAGTTEISEDEFYREVDNLFGEDAGIEIMAVSGCGYGNLSYDSKKDVFVSSDGRCGGAPNSFYVHDVISTKESDTKAVIEEKVFFVTPAANFGDPDEAYDIYSADGKKLIASGIIASDSLEDWEEEIKEEYGDYADTYRYTFEKRPEGVYSFLQVEKLQQMIEPEDL